MPRNRQIYPADAIFISDGTLSPIATHPSGNIKQLHRVQNAKYGGQLTRTDINQFGQLGRIDSLVIQSPEYTFDTEYYLHDGYNEDKMGLTLSSDFSVSALSGLLVSDTGLNLGGAGVLSGRNIFVLTVPEGNDANLFTSVNSGNSIVNVGNAFITEYNVSAAVGSIPSATVTYQGFNGRASAFVLNSGQLGSVDNVGVESSGTFTLPPAQTGTGLTVTALRPGDVLLTLNDSAIMTDLNDAGNGASAHIQSFSISVPLARTVLQRLGSNFGYAREINFPVDIDVSVSAIVADLKSGSFVQALMANTKTDLMLLLKDSGGVGRIAYKVKAAQIVSENFSSAIGSNKTVDIKFTAQIAGPTDPNAGLFISGATTAVDFND